MIKDLICFKILLLLNEIYQNMQALIFFNVFNLYKNISLFCFVLEHPAAFTAIECFHKIDGDLRHLLKKRRVPIVNI